MAVYLISAVDGDKEQATVIIKGRHLKAAVNAAYAFRERFFKVEPSAKVDGYEAEKLGQGLYRISCDYTHNGQPWVHVRDVFVKQVKEIEPRLPRVYVS